MKWHIQAVVIIVIENDILEMLLISRTQIGAIAKVGGLREEFVYS